MRRATRPPVDKTTRSVMTIDFAHNEAQDGSSYHCSDVQSVDTTTQKWMITTPDTTKWAHMLFSVECTGEMTILVTEGADRNGTNALDEVNHNRNSSKVAGVAVHRDVAAGTTDGATTVFTQRTGTNWASSTARGTNEYILAQNTKYVISVTTYAAVFVSLELDWYEHTDKP